MKNFKQLIRQDVRELGIESSFMGEQELYLALDIINENPLRLCSITKLLYFDIADTMNIHPSCVERNFRTFVKKLWMIDDHQYLDKIAGRRLKKRPTNKEFLDMMRVYWCEDDDEE